jgi:hypothetical protein
MVYATSQRIVAVHPTLHGLLSGPALVILLFVRAKDCSAAYSAVYSLRTERFCVMNI